MIEIPRLEPKEIVASTMRAGPPASRIRWIQRAD